MADDNESVEVVFPHAAIISYPRLFKPVSDRQGGERFSAMFLIDKTTPEGQETAKAIIQAMLNATRMGFVRGGGENRKSPVFSKDMLIAAKVVSSDFDYTDDTQLKRFMEHITLPLKDGDSDRYQKGVNRNRLRSEVDPHYANHWFIEGTTKKTEERNRVPAIQVVDGKRVDLDDRTLVAGNLCRAKLLFLAYKTQDGDLGVKCFLQAVVKDADGEPFFDPRDTDPFSGFGLPAENADDAFAGMI